jgi:hypothetical protein
VAAALCGGDAEGVCSYVVGSGELARGWHWTGPRDKRACASTPCLRGVRLGSWRARRGHMQCQQGRRKQRRCVGPCRWVLGVGITAASSDADQHRWLSGEVTPQCINARDDSTGQQGVWRTSMRHEECDVWVAKRGKFGRWRPTVSQQRKGTGLGGNERGIESGA